MEVQGQLLQGLMCQQLIKLLMFLLQLLQDTEEEFTVMEVVTSWQSLVHPVIIGTMEEVSLFILIMEWVLSQLLRLFYFVSFFVVVVLLFINYAITVDMVIKLELQKLSKRLLSYRDTQLLKLINQGILLKLQW